MAAILFQHRHGQALSQAATEWHYERLNAIAELGQLLKRYPKACIWFDNVLGQLRYVTRDEHALQHQLHTLKQQLRQRQWGSVHDWLSGPVLAPPSLASLRPHWLHLNQAGDHVCYDSGQNQTTEAAVQGLLASVKATGIWQDHGCQHVLPVNATRCWIPWAFSDTHWHWLELGWH